MAWLANRVRFGVIYIYKESEAKLKGKVCKTVLRPAMMTLFLGMNRNRNEKQNMLFSSVRGFTFRT